MLLITFSGLDGSGKSTHAVLTAAHLTAQGHRVGLLATANISVAGLVKLMRHSLSNLISIRKGYREPNCLASARGAEPDWNTTPGNPPSGTARADSARWFGGSDEPLQAAAYAIGTTAPRNARSRAITLSRRIAYPLDCIAVAYRIQLLAWLGHTAVVCDRYVFDKLVNLSEPTGWLGRWMIRLVPRADRSFLIDADLDVARSRRPEHPPGYYETKHAGYDRLGDAGLGLIRIASTTIEETQDRIERAIAARVSEGRSACLAEAS